MISIIPYEDLETYAVQSWLDEKARDGWQLKRFYGRYARFERSEPRETRYRLDILTAEKYDNEDELLQAYREQGWEYVCDYAAHRFRLFRSDDPNAIELHTDPEVFRRAMRSSMRSSILALVLFAIFLLIQLFGRGGLLSLLSGDAMLQLLTGNMLYYLLAVFFLILFWVLFLVISLGAVSRAGRDLQEGYAGKRPSARRCQVRHLLLLLLMCFVVIFTITAKYTGEAAYPVVSPEEEMILPRWEDLAPEEYHAATDQLSEESRYESRLRIERTSPFAVSIECQREYDHTGQKYYAVDRYRMRSDALANLVYSLLCERDHASPLDENVSFGQRDDAQYLILQSGDTIIWVSYQGEVDLRQAQELYQNVLNED